MKRSLRQAKANGPKGSLTTPSVYAASLSQYPTKIHSEPLPVLAGDEPREQHVHVRIRHVGRQLARVRFKGFPERP